MKVTINRLLLLVLIGFISGCSDDSADSGSNNGSTELGTFVGNIQVTDDPQTSLGYIYNASVKVTRTGSTATLIITGDLGFNRTYTGSVTSQLNDLFVMSITKQTKPTDKIAGDQLLISGNKLALIVNLASDNVTVKDNPNATNSKTISGKINMAGTDLLRQ